MPYLNDNEASAILNTLKMAQGYVDEFSPHHYEDVHMRQAVKLMQKSIDAVPIADEQPQILELLYRAFQRGDSVERVHAAIVAALK